jgi:hypothetical protein
MRILKAHLTRAGKKKWQSVDDGVQELEERLLRPPRRTTSVS